MPGIMELIWTDAIESYDVGQICERFGVKRSRGFGD